MPDECLPQIQACAMRVAKVNPLTGAPLVGAGNLIVSNALTELTYTTVYSDGTDVFEPNACGDPIVDYKSNDIKRRIDVGLVIGTHDPDLLAFLAASATIVDGDATGWQAPAVGRIPDSVLSIELWAKRINDGDLDPDYPYAWWAFPKIKNLKEEANKFGNASKLPAFSGQGYENAGWGNGPLNDWPALSDRTHQWIPTTDLPDVVCGTQAIAADAP